MLQTYCDLQREVLDRALGSLPNQATSSEDLSKMSWSQVEKKVNGQVHSWKWQEYPQPHDMQASFVWMSHS